jgi:ATP-binding cassette subfamily B protein
MNATRETIRFYWRHACRYPGLVTGALVSLPVTIVLGQILPPLIISRVLRRLAAGDYQPHHIWASFGPSMVAYAALMLFSGMLMWRVVDYFGWRLEANVLRSIGQEVFAHLMKQSASFHANHFGGSMVSQTNKLLGSYIRMADTTLYNVLPLAITLVSAAIVLAKPAPLFVVILLTFSIVYIVTAFFVTRKVRELGAINATIESKQTGYLADCITNVMAIKSFASGMFENKQFAKATNDTHQSTLNMMHGHARQQLYFGGLVNIIAASSLTMAVFGVMTFHANVATVFLILAYTTSITSQLFTFSNNALRNYNRSVGDAKDMVEILQITPEVQDPAQPEEPHIGAGAIEFKDVTFTHDGSSDALFHNLNLRIKPGEKIGLVGHSGSGKTTFTRLLLHFSDIDGGEILIDDQNIAHVRQDDLRAQIAYVPQEPLLFHRSIRENIAYGRPDATEADILEAARKAHADDFIRTLPQGYETLVGERGVKLSGGQRQRIVIARAILKDAPILVLDEATSALDSESELLIQDALWKLMQQRTAIVIAHRLSTIQKMDRIVVLEDGAITEEGSHQELLKHKGTYAQLWAHQSGGFIED